MRPVYRSLKIWWVIARYRLDTFFVSQKLPLPLRILLWVLPWRYLIPAKGSSAVRLRLALEALGPVFIKFGQMLSTRRDLLADDVALELARLQDRVPPFSGSQAQLIIEESLGQPVAQLFAVFEQEPMASASVAQVHSATLKNGKAVVVKVIRPGIGKVIQQDISLLYTLAWLVCKLWKEGRRLRPLEVVEEYEQTIFDELDLRKEAANGSQLRRNFDGSSILYVPEIYWDYTRRNVLVMERIYGIPVANMDQLRAQNTNMEKLAERGVEIFFTQVFRDSFFHADMHPGNIFVSMDNPEDPQYIAIDFGIIGSLSEEDQSYLARNILAFFRRDYRQVAQLHIDSGWVPGNTNVHAFETAIRSVCEPIFEKPLKEISFGLVLLGLFQTARRFNMEVQPQLVLLQKTLLNIEGLGRQLYPDLDLWKTAKPFLENWMKERMGPKAVFDAVKEQAPEWLEKFPQVPQLLFDVLQSAKRNKDDLVQIETKMRQDAELKTQSSRRYMLLGVTFFTLALVTISPNLSYESIPVEGWVLLSLGWLSIWKA
ncbi:ubiquinone biosynthesis regulatory protein kinase UbiB [Nitrincola tibetensis]|uniref:Probable protein kinase UbiB n=1 Tax=Nitrincola tibetensis TaxID=2219697 RepID=A0A364NIC3_9GAMM|nr:ubiquinone biosynthesis regulatory protein kinase UbiB [Nitrincola tibetensis]RAU16780.1 ubiquinone biosynthesis regulatory protein kinase UbiB [Nitrincola tibetensis]